MSQYKPYPAYKNSGVEWLGWVPEHWYVARMRYVATLNPPVRRDLLDDPEQEVSFLPMEAIGEDGSLNLEQNRPVADVRSGYSYFENGDVAFAKVTPCFENGKGALMLGLQRAAGFGTTELTVLRPNPAVADARYINYIVQASSFRAFGAGAMTGAGGLKRVPDEFTRNFPVSLPDLNEQRLIACKLDRETARIDALIEKKTRFIELLREKRQALITHAVTKGLDPKVKMKDSSVAWLGEVPEHWDVAPMKYVCELLKDGTHLPPPRTDEGVPLLSVRNIIDGHFTLRDDDSTISHQNYMELCKAFIPQEGDVLLAVVGATLGKTALIPAALGQFHIQRSLAIFRPHHGRMNSRWLHLIFQSSLFQSLLWEHAGYSAQPGIYLGTLAGFSIPQPPLNEQAQIFSYLSGRIARLDSLIRTTESSIELLKERRSALITAAVTGQIDLREAL
ncbi:restriction endonuclease subunit S [Ectopseudomonas composti]